MKSIQFNYFASGDDMLFIAQILLDWQPNLVLFPPRGSGGVLRGAGICGVTSLIPRSAGEMHLLCAADDSSRVSTTIVTPDNSCIVIQENPVIEYSPSAPVNQETVQIGRLYAAYDEVDFMKQFRRLIELLKRSAVPMNKAGLWIFPAAAKAEKLRPWGGDDWDNPFLN